MADDVLAQTSLGSTDWTGGRGPAGGTHTGTSTITMVDGFQVVVSSNPTEVRRKLDLHAIAQTMPTWVAFDTATTTAGVVVLNVGNVQSVK